MKTYQTTWLACALAVTLVLGACGGSKDENAVVVVTPPPPPPPVVVTDVPDSAAASIGAFISFIMALVNSEDREPLTLRDTIIVPLDEVSEPVLLT